MLHSGRFLVAAAIYEPLGIRREEDLMSPSTRQLRAIPPHFNAEKGKM